MRKVIKISGTVLSAVVLLSIILPVVLSLLLDIPSVQNFVARRAMEAISEHLGTQVRLDRIDVGLFSRVRIDGFYVEDYGGDTLLYARRVDARVSTLGLFGGGPEFGSGRLVDGKFFLRQMENGDMNIKQVVDRLSNPHRKGKGDFRLHFGKLSVENLTFCLDRRVAHEPRYGIDFAHLHLSELNARISDFTIDGQTIHADIGTLSARERSGFRIGNLSGRFYLTQGCLGFEDLAVDTERSVVRLPYISLVGLSWGDYRDFLDQVRIDAAVRRTTLATDDIAYFAPRLRDWHITFRDVDIETAGFVSDFSATVRRLRLGDSTSLSGRVALHGLPDIAKTRFDLTIPELHTSVAEADDLMRRIAGRGLSEPLVRRLSEVGKVGLDLRFRGLLSSFDLRVEASTGAGDIGGRLSLAPREGGRSGLQGEVATRKLRLGRLLGRGGLFGDAAFSARIEGTVGRGGADARIEGQVARVEFNGYAYDSLRLDGRFRNRRFDGRVAARDRNLNFDFFGLVDLNDSVPNYDFTLCLNRADLARLRINRRDSVSELSARLVAKGRGGSLDDLNGSIRMTDVRYRYNDREIAAEEITVTGANSDESKLVELRSDFADATFRSKTSYRTVFEYLRRSALRSVPRLREEEPEGSLMRGRMSVADDFSMLDVELRKANPIADAVVPGLQIADGSSLRMLFNPASDRLSLKVASEYVERGKTLATRLHLNASNRGDSLVVYASAEDLYAGILHLPQLSVTGGAKQGRIQLTAGFVDTVGKSSGLLGVRVGMVGADSLGGRAIGLQVLPSYVTRGDKTWQIFSRGIRIDTARIAIDRFWVMNDRQSLLVNGVASRSREDSVVLSLRNFDMGPFAQVAERLGYEIEGRMNGSATVKSLLRDAEVSADILFDEVEANGIVAPPLRLTSRWDFARSRARVTVTDRVARDTLVRG